MARLETRFDGLADGEREGERAGELEHRWSATAPRTASSVAAFSTAAARSAASASLMELAAGCIIAELVVPLLPTRGSACAAGLFMLLTCQCGTGVLWQRWNGTPLPERALPGRALLGMACPTGRCALTSSDPSPRLCNSWLSFTVVRWCSRFSTSSSHSRVRVRFSKCWRLCVGEKREREERERRVREEKREREDGRVWRDFEGAPTRQVPRCERRPAREGERHRVSNVAVLVLGSIRGKCVSEGVACAPVHTR